MHGLVDLPRGAKLHQHANVIGAVIEVVAREVAQHGGAEPRVFLATVHCGGERGPPPRGRAAAMTVPSVAQGVGQLHPRGRGAGGMDFGLSAGVGRCLLAAH